MLCSRSAYLPCPVRPCPALHCPDLSKPFRLYPTLCYPNPFYHISNALPCPVLYFPALPCSALVISTSCQFGPRSILTCFKFSPWSFQHRVFSLPGHFVPGSFWCRAISATGHFGSVPFSSLVSSGPIYFCHGSFRPRNILVPVFNWPLDILVSGHFYPRSFRY